MTKPQRPRHKSSRLKRLQRFFRLYSERTEKIDLNEFDWAFACYLAKQGDLSELLWMLRDESDIYKPPTLRARRIIASLLQSRGVYRRRRRLSEREIEQIRTVFKQLVKEYPNVKKTWWYRRFAEEHNTGESTIRDIIGRRRDFAGK